MTDDWGTENLGFMRRIVNAPPVQLVPGEQLWLLARANVDGATVETVERELLGLLTATWQTVQSAWPWQHVETGDDEYRLGNVRPMRVTISTVREPQLPAGRRLVTREQFPGSGLPALEGPPVWCLVRFWWRAGPVAVPWPLGFPVSLATALPATRSISELRWMLTDARVPAELSQDPGDEAWAHAQADNVVEAVTDAASDVAAPVWRVVPWVLGGLGALGLGWLVWRFRK